MGRVVEISPGGGSTIRSGTTPYTREHLEVAGQHSRKGGMLPQLSTLHRVGTEAGDDLEHDMVVPRRGT